MRNIAVVAPIAARYDAISAAAIENHRLLAADPALRATLLTSHNETGAPAAIVPGVSHLLAHPAYRAADLILSHFGIYHPFHDALPIGNGHARRVAVFHNVTPPHLVSEAARPLIERSLQQAHTLSHADEIWADSAFNAADLACFGIDPARIRVVPLGVARPALGRLADKPGGLNLLFVGRIVAAKGVHELIEAVRRARPRLPAPLRARLRLTLAGNSAFSDPAYLAACRAALPDGATLVDTPDDAALARLYADAHLLCIPSHHEGFCVPVIEGLRAGCLLLGTRAGNIPANAAGLGRLVPPGDIDALADSLVALATALDDARADPAAPLPLDAGPHTVAAFDEAARVHVAGFAPEAIAKIKRAHIERLLEGLPPNPYAGLLDAPTPTPVSAPPAAPPLRLDLATLRRIPGARPAARLLRRRLPGAAHWLLHRTPRPALLAAPDPAPESLPPDARAAHRRLAFAARHRPEA